VKVEGLSFSVGVIVYLRRYLTSISKLVFISILVTSCTAAGFQEFQIYSQAYDAQYVQADLVLQAVGSAEKSLRASIEPRSNPNGYFEPDYAAYYVDGVEPPQTAAIRASLKVIKSYNDAMIALASGENAKALSARISSLTVNVSTAITAVTSMGASVASTAPAAGLASTLLKQLKYLPFVTEAAAVASRESFRRDLIKSAPTVRAMLTTLRDEGTPVMYELMRRASGKSPSKANPRGLPDPAAQKLLAGWVLLLDKTNLALKTAADAAETGSQINLDTLNQASVELAVLAEQIRAANVKDKK